MNFDTYSNIVAVSVGRAVGGGVLGVQGHIKAEKGTIGRIWSTGPIGSQASPIQIWAANGIGEVRTVVAPNGPNYQVDIVLVDIDADIRANVNFGLSQTGPDPVNDGRLKFVESGGAIRGEIRAANMDAQGVRNSHEGVCGGILALGPIEAPIIIDYIAQYVTIAATKFTEPIVIGKTFKGAIVAFGDNFHPSDPLYDPNDGTIDSVTIGRGNTGPYPGYQPGFAGSGGTPIMYLGPVPSPVMGWRPEDPNPEADQPLAIRWLFPSHSDVGAVDCVIHAENKIGTASVKAMSHAFPGIKMGRPRIEAPRIDTLVIDEKKCGVVWSGVLEYDVDTLGAHFMSNAPSTDYASIGEATIGSMTPTADVWFKDCPLFKIVGDVQGELHLPSLGAGEVIRISDRVTDVNSSDFGCLPSLGGRGNQQCSGGPEVCGYICVANEEISPRSAPAFAAEALDGVALRGGIYIEDANGLNGQIIIDAARTGEPIGQRPETHLLGFVKVGSAVLETVAGADLRLTVYLAPSHEFSTSGVAGAIGLAPFDLYHRDCAPPMPSPTIAAVLSNTSFNQQPDGLPILVRWYGPVTLPGSGSAAVIERRDGSSWVDVTSQFVQSADAQPRTLKLTSASGGVSAGTYQVRPVNLTCGGGVAAGTGVLQTPYMFRLVCSYDGGGLPNPADIATSGSSDPFAGPDGFVTGDDFDLFIQAFFQELQWPTGGYVADLVDGDGAPGGDGFLTGADFDAFIEAFFKGCSLT